MFSAYEDSELIVNVLVPKFLVALFCDSSSCQARSDPFNTRQLSCGTGEKGVLFWVPLGYHCGYHWVPALVGDSNSNDPKTRLKTNKEYCFFISMWHHSMACLSWLICHQELRGTLWGWVCERPGDHCHLHVMTFQ